MALRNNFKVTKKFIIPKYLQTKQANQFRCRFLKKFIFITNNNSSRFIWRQIYHSKPKSDKSYKLLKQLPSVKSEPIHLNFEGMCTSCVYFSKLYLISKQMSLIRLKLSFKGKLEATHLGVQRDETKTFCG